MVIRTPGNLGAKRLNAYNKASAKMHDATDHTWALSRRTASCHTSAMKLSDRGTVMPVTAGSCEKAITRAAALIKPSSTGCDSRLSNTPARASPNPSWIKPEISDSSVT